MCHHLPAWEAKNPHHLLPHTFPSWLLRKQTFTQTQMKRKSSYIFKNVKGKEKQRSTLKKKTHLFKRSYLQFPALTASQNDQKSVCEGFRESISMRTQKYSASPYLLDWIASNKAFSAIMDKDAC